MVKPLLYHHCREFEHVRYDIVIPWRITQALPPCTCPSASDIEHLPAEDAYHDALHFEACYRWLAQRVGFWPLWLAVGASDEDRRMSGYSRQWQRGREDNLVLFSWAQVPALDLRYLCYEHWYIVLNSVDYQGWHPRAAEVTPQIEKWVLHPRRSEREWLRAAAREVHSVQAVAPMLDLRTAEGVWCRNQATANALTAMGFERERVYVQRLPVSA
jgi:hypothetical protein